MELGQWTFLDYLFIFIILISIGFALMKGLLREITSIVALIAGFILAVLYYRVPAAWLSAYTKTEAVAGLGGFLIIFLGCILIGAVISLVINRFLKAASIKWVDRLLGGVFGLLRGWAICSIIVLSLIAFPISENFMARSFMAPWLLAGARTAVYLVPQHMKDQFNEQYKKVRQAWNRSRSAA